VCLPFHAFWTEGPRQDVVISIALTANGCQLHNTLSLSAIVKRMLALINSVQSTSPVRISFHFLIYVVLKGQHRNGGKIELDILADLQIFSISQ
jgi:hypothetical protein